MKKLIGMLAAFALLAALPVAVFAAQPVTLKMADVSVETGTQTVTLTLICDTAEKVGDGQLLVTFPADKLELTGAASPLSETAINTRKAAEGRVQMGFMTDAGLNASQTLLTLTFQIKNPQAEGSYTVAARATRMADLNYKNLIQPAAEVSVSATVTVEAKTVPAPQPDPEVERLREELEELISQEIDGEKYTAESLEAYREALQRAQALSANDSATAQQLEDVIEELNTTLVEISQDPAVLLGDVNGDGNITSTDARLVLQLAVGKIKESDLKVPAAANVNSDSTVTSTDARLILQRAVGKLSGFEGL